MAQPDGDQVEAPGGNLGSQLQGRSGLLERLRLLPSGSIVMTTTVGWIRPPTFCYRRESYCRGRANDRDSLETLKLGGVCTSRFDGISFSKNVIVAAL